MIPQTLIHASCVAVSGRGALIIGPSGSGKSSLAITLMSLGADLVADDQTELTVQNGQLTARCPEILAGLIEARGIGLLKVAHQPQARIHLAIDLGTKEPHRLPPARKLTLLGTEVDLVLGQGNDHLSSAVLCYLKGARQA